MYYYFLEVTFTIIFIATCWNSISKYMEGTVAVSWQQFDILDVQYPAISVCVDNAYKAGFDDLFFRNDSISVKEVEEIVKENVWKRNETLYYVNFPSDNNPGYECMTSRDSYDPNKPCLFPFYYGDVFINNCTALGEAPFISPSSSS